ncbi:MAG TPA: nucleotidyl transferase AbiEii/AbiGii toxin family protein [Dongiaceae bacterium]|nr:nucleotidyl transferase AbiEii/AbiGii toxin family protein [Dongiaceae bacterium]
MLKPDLTVLPREQLEFWNGAAGDMPAGFVLYGDTAIALQCGHRESVDFDWFASRTGLLRPIEDFLRRFRSRRVLQQDARTLVVSVQIGRRPLKLFFFEGLKFGRVGVPRRCANGVSVASPLDLLATKLKTVQQRAEAKDYIDIDALLESGLTLRRGIAAAQALYPDLNPLWTAKTVGWFGEGSLEADIPMEVRARLATASAAWRPLARAKLRSRSLLPAR